jgi:general secretion pathway protein K
MVVLAIAILTAVATDFTYNSRVDLELATNQRDELQAHYLAQSGVALSRLLLRFQHQLDGIQLPNIAGLLSGLGGGSGGLAGMLSSLTGGGASTAGSTTPMASSLSLQIWRMAHVDCHMLQGLVPPTAEGTGAGSQSLRAKSRAPAPRPPPVPRPGAYSADFPDLAAKQDQLSFGSFKGCFDTKIENEEEKLNVNQLNAPQMTAAAAGLRLLKLFGDKRFEFVFLSEDANHVRVTAQDVLINLRDWVDDDLVQSTLNLTGTGDLFVKGFSDELGPYDRYPVRYHPKNAPFDSLDELHMVHGVSDRFMAAFRDRLTVYPDINTALNINSDDPLLLYMAILSVSDPLRPDPRLQDPLFVDSIIQKIRQARMLSFFGMSVSDFVTIVQSSGIAVSGGMSSGTSTSNRYVSDKSTTFTIKATGEAGHVRRTIEAVVRLDNGLGRLMHWRED